MIMRIIGVHALLEWARQFELAARVSMGELLINFGQK